ncbi:sigma factor [Ruminococcus albus]|uniref:sigma factor n=1 Tax=Ruminococcus albus TaxID=1264 RepID=UPI0001CEDC69|nr:sigma factor [Ruminococcus albus]MCC3351591.1 hypothetical protein [Ruminococcus albus 8]
MNKINKNELTEYAELLLQAAVRKCDDFADAQDLVQETLLVALTAIENGREIAEGIMICCGRNTANRQSASMLLGRYPMKAALMTARKMWRISAVVLLI